MKLAPIVLFVYKRPEHTRHTIEHLKQNNWASESDLYIFSEYPKTNEFAEQVNIVRELLKTITGFKSVTVIERPVFYGLAKSVINGVSEVLQTHNKIIVLEDDIITSKHFLEYMNDALDTFESNLNIFSVTGFMYPPGLIKIYNEYN